MLDYGYIPNLGIGAWWTVFVLGIHTIWSTAVPIALVESLTPDARHTPWLGTLGFIVTVFVFVIGCVLSFVFQQQDPFMASTTQFVMSGVIVVALIIVAVVFGRTKVNAHLSTQRSPSTRVVAGVAFILGSAFMSLAIVHDTIPVSLNIAGMM